MLNVYFPPAPVLRTQIPPVPVLQEVHPVFDLLQRSVKKMVHVKDSEDHMGSVFVADKTSTDDSGAYGSIVPVGRENLSNALPPHESYEGRHRWDPNVVWSQKEERSLVWKTDRYLLSWICVMVGNA